MREEVYDFLRAFGFTKDEVYSFEKENEKMFFTNLVEVHKNMVFLLSKGLNKEEIMHVFRKDPYMITVKNNRLERLDEIYLMDLQMDEASLKRLILMNPDVYISSVADLREIIAFLRELDYTTEDIKRLFISNPNYVSMSLDEFRCEYERG